jgi:hypothetical protein
METPQPPHVSVSGHIVIQGQLPPASSASPDSVPPQPPRPWWKFWQRWQDFHKLTAYATLLLALGTAALAIFSLVTLLVTHADTRRLIKEARIASNQQHTDTLTALGKTDATIAAMKESNRINRESYTYSQRAWVSCNVVMADDLIFDVNGASVTLGCVFNNTGHSPALKALFQARVIVDVRWDPQAEQNHVCADAETRIGADVFPGEPVANVRMAHIGDDKLKELRKVGETLYYTAAILPSVVTCIGYRIIGDEKYHHTPRILTLSRQNKPINISDGTVPKSELTLKIWPLQEAVAD